MCFYQMWDEAERECVSERRGEGSDLLLFVCRWCSASLHDTCMTRTTHVRMDRDGQWMDMMSRWTCPIYARFPWSLSFNLKLYRPQCASPDFFPRNYHLSCLFLGDPLTFVTFADSVLMKSWPTLSHSPLTIPHLPYFTHL